MLTIPFQSFSIFFTLWPDLFARMRCLRICAQAVLVQGNNHYFLHNIIKSWTTEGWWWDLTSQISGELLALACLGCLACRMAKSYMGTWMARSMAISFCLASMGYPIWGVFTNAMYQGLAKIPSANQRNWSTRVVLLYWSFMRAGIQYLCSFWTERASFRYSGIETDQK